MDPRDTVGRNYESNYLLLLHRKYRSSVLCGFREKNFYVFSIYVLEMYTPYIEKLGFAGVNLFFLFLTQNIDCGYSIEPPRRGGSNVYPQSLF